MFAQVSTPCIVFSSVPPYNVITPPTNTGKATELLYTPYKSSSTSVRLSTPPSFCNSQMLLTPENSTSPNSSFESAKSPSYHPSTSVSHPSTQAEQISNNSGQVSDDYKVYVGAETHSDAYCPVLGLLLVKVVTVEKVQVFHYDPESNNLLPHYCSTCTSRPSSVREEDLTPLYSVRVSDGSHVVFMKTLNSGKVRQFRMTAFGGLEQIENSNVQYNPRAELPFLFTVFQDGNSQVVIVKNQMDKKKWTKEYYGKEGKAVIPPMPVRTLPTYDSSSYDERRPAYRIRLCPHSERQIVHIKLDGVIEKFWYDGLVGHFVTFDCSLCRVRVTEEHLIPKYSVYHEATQTYVIFFYNVETGNVEQYLYNSATMGLEQVHYPELVYDSEKGSLDEILVELHEDCQLVIRRNVDGSGFRKQLRLDGRILRIPAYPVKTLKL